jgi:hypothetical protein
MKKAGREARAFDDFEAMENALYSRMTAQGDRGQVFVFFSNGAFGGILPRLLAELES